MEQPRLSPNELADYLVEIGGMLVSAGCPSYRLEEVIRVVAAHEKYNAEAFAFPTGLFVQLHGPDIAHPILRMARVRDWGLDLERLVRVDAIFNDVAERRYGIREARLRLYALERKRPLYPRAVTWFAAAGVSGAAAIFFRGGLGEVGVSAAAGGAVAVLGTFLSKGPKRRLLVDFLGGFTAATFAFVATYAEPSLSREVVVLSGAIALVPGMTLTTALAEVAQKNLVSGSSRLTEALVTFLSILTGIAFAVGIEQVLGVEGAKIVAAVRPDLGLGYQAGALVISALGFAILFSVPKRYAWAALLSGAIGYVATALATRTLPPYAAGFAAALCVCVFANGVARLTRRPAQVFQLPGFVLLVPGSFGFLSLEAFLRGEFLGGAAKAFDMMLIAGALVTGVLFANALVPAKKLL